MNLKLFILLITNVLSKKMVEMKQYKLYSSSCGGILNTENYDLQKCYMDTLMHDNYGLSISFDYCSIDDKEVKLLQYDNKKCSTNNNLVVKYLKESYYKVNGGCYTFKCIEVEEDGNFFDGLIGAGVIVGIILYCCLPCILLSLCIYLCVRVCQNNNEVINNNMIQQPQPHIIVHNPNLQYPQPIIHNPKLQHPQSIQMTQQVIEGL